jgi:hypothetical protein
MDNYILYGAEFSVLSWRREGGEDKNSIPQWEKLTIFMNYQMINIFGMKGVRCE